MLKITCVCFFFYPILETEATRPSNEHVGSRWEAIYYGRKTPLHYVTEGMGQILRRHNVLPKVTLVQDAGPNDQTL